MSTVTITKETKKFNIPFLKKKPNKFFCIEALTAWIKAANKKGLKLGGGNPSSWKVISKETITL